MQEQNRGGSLESLQYQHNLIARIIHKTNLCQQGLITLIEEELRPQSSSSPLRTSWTSYMIEEIKRDDKRCYDSFIKLHNTIDIERKMFETIIFESENVDYQEFILKSYLPKGDPENILSALPYLIINRHRPPFLEWFGSFTDYILGQSYHPIDHAMPLIVSPASVQHSVIYPSLFSAESVEEMIERTQQLYLESITELESPIELWGKNCQSLWQSYLNEAYPYDQHEIDNNPIKEEHESETLAQAYKELIQSVKGMYSSDLRLEIRQSIAQRANNMFGKNTISFLKNKVTEQGEKIPTTFDSWSERKQRDYFHLNKPAVREDDINPNIIFTGSTKPQYFVSREFALVILLSEGIITSRHPFHEKITKVTKLPSCHYTQKVLDLCGYNSR